MIAMPIYQTTYRFADFQGVNRKDEAFVSSLQRLRTLSKEFDRFVQTEAAKASGEIIERAEEVIGKKQYKIEMIANDLEDTCRKMQHRYAGLVNSIEKQDITIYYQQNELSL